MAGCTHGRKTEEAGSLGNKRTRFCGYADEKLCVLYFNKPSNDIANARCGLQLPVEPICAVVSKRHSAAWSQILTKVGHCSCRLRDEP